MPAARDERQTSGVTATVVPRADSASSGASAQRLPTDLLRKSRGRLRLLAALIVFGFSSDYFFEAIGWFVNGRQEPLLAAFGRLYGNVAGLVWGGAMLAVTFMRRLPDSVVITIGLVFQVGVCLIVSLGNISSNWASSGEVPTMTWVTPLIIMFPLITPSPPRRVLVASLASAATAPLAVWIISATGAQVATGDDYVRSVVQPLMAVIFGVIGARVVWGLGVEVHEGRRALERAQEMGSYRLESLIGRGGMGEVWRASHRLIRRPAAIKLIRPEALGGDTLERRRMVDRFRREAEATASMRSPHTIEIYDFGVTDEGAFYYVMELLDGVDADTLIERFGSVPPERAASILLQMCDSLGEAHAQDLIHRDVKPANVFICRYGRECDFVKVLDFGLVKAATTAKETDASLTREHTALGTPAFMSPEQIVGQDIVDARSDVYAVGCVAYWLLTGVLVFDAESSSKMMMSHVRDVPVPPSERSEMPIPRGLDEIVMGCLEKDPARRPQSVDELADQLHKLGLDQTWTQERAREWWDAHLPASR